MNHLPIYTGFARKYLCRSLTKADGLPAREGRTDRMFRHALMPCAVLCALLCSSCGTIITTAEGRVMPYNGTAFDCGTVAGVFNGSLITYDTNDPFLANTLFLLIFVPDIPLSLVADTVLLPYDLTNTFIPFAGEQADEIYAYYSKNKEGRRIRDDATVRQILQLVRKHRYGWQKTHDPLDALYPTATLTVMRQGQKIGTVHMGNSVLIVGDMVRMSNADDADIAQLWRCCFGKPMETQRSQEAVVIIEILKPEEHLGHSIDENGGHSTWCDGSRGRIPGSGEDFVIWWNNGENKDRPFRFEPGKTYSVEFKGKLGTGVMGYQGKCLHLGQVLKVEPVK